MPLKPRFTNSDVDRYFARKLKGIDDAIIFNLQALGEACINKAREDGSYTDQTGNLRSSIGYIIVRNGDIIKKSSFASYGKGGSEGKQSGQDLLNQLSSKYSTGYALIVVAGMDYAAKVESLGKNVLSTAEHYAEVELPKMLRNLKRKIKIK